LPVNLEEQPENIVTVRVDSDTGERATESSRRSYFEIFKVGTEPKEYTAGSLNSAGANAENPGTIQEENIENEIF
jgi:membrane carboxypeptidase/penicillin-binding protein